MARWPLDTSSDTASVYVFRCGHQWHPYQPFPPSYQELLSHYPLSCLNPLPAGTGLSLHTTPLYIVTCKIPDALQLVIHVPPFSLLPPSQVFSALSQISKHCVDLAELVVEAEVFPSVLTSLRDPDEYVRKNTATLIREIAKHTPEVGRHDCQERL